MDKEALYAQIDQSPEDWALYLLLADIYEDHGGYPAADCLRRMASQGKRPNTCGSTVRNNLTYDWWVLTPDGAGDVPFARLPMSLFLSLNLTLGHKYSEYCYEFPTRRAAMEALYTAKYKVLRMKKKVLAALK